MSVNVNGPVHVPAPAGQVLLSFQWFGDEYSGNDRWAVSEVPIIAWVCDPAGDSVFLFGAVPVLPWLAVECTEKQIKEPTDSRAILFPDGRVWSAEPSQFHASRAEWESIMVELNEMPKFLPMHRTAEEP